MKRLFWALAVAFCTAGALAADKTAEIIFTNKVASFTNLQGKAFVDIELVKANLDGIVWRKDGALGQVNFSNLDPAFLDSLGVDASRRELAAHRAAKSASYDATVRANQAKQAAQTAQAAQADVAAIRDSPALVTWDFNRKDVFGVAGNTTKEKITLELIFTEYEGGVRLGDSWTPVTLHLEPNEKAAFETSVPRHEFKIQGEVIKSNGSRVPVKTYKQGEKLLKQ